MKFTASVIIAAAGKGARARRNINKVYVDLKGKPVLVRTLNKFLQIQNVSDIIVVISHQDEDIFKNAILKHQTIINNKHKIKYVFGGNTRQESVFNGLRCIDEKSDFVVVHDGARPLTDKNNINAVMNKAYEFGAACLGVKVKNTIKKYDNKTKKILTTFKREELISVNTPQVFKKEIIQFAYKNAFLNKIQGSDDSTLVEKAGYSVYIVKDSYNNIKITTPEDFIIAKQLLRRENG